MIHAAAQFYPKQEVTCGQGAASPYPLDCVGLLVSYLNDDVGQDPHHYQWNSNSVGSKCTSLNSFGRCQAIFCSDQSGEMYEIPTVTYGTYLQAIYNKCGAYGTAGSKAPFIITYNKTIDVSGTSVVVAPSNMTGYVAFADNNPGGKMPKPSGTAVLSEITFPQSTPVSAPISPRNPPVARYFDRGARTQMYMPFMRPSFFLSLAGVLPRAVDQFSSVGAAQLDTFRSTIAAALLNAGSQTFVTQTVAPMGAPALFFDWQQIPPQMQHLPPSLGAASFISDIFQGDADLTAAFVQYATQFFTDQLFPQFLTLTVDQQVQDPAGPPGCFFARAVATITFGYAARAGGPIGG